VETLFSASPLQSKGNSEDAAGEPPDPISAAPVSTLAPPPAPIHRKPINVEMSEQEPESDDGTEGGEKIKVADSAALTVKPHETIMLHPRQSSSESSSAGSSSSLSNDSDEKEQHASADKPVTDAPSARRASAVSEVSEGGSSQSESDAYFVSQEDPAAVDAELNASGAKLISGRILGSLRFESSDREHRFLSEAGGSFCFLLMEKELMKTSVSNVLRCAGDLARKTFITTRCGARQIEAHGSPSSQMGTLEKVAKLEEEKTALAKELESEKSQHASAV
jgi:hypothetical protein